MSYYSIQQQEEADYQMGSASELQNAFRWSQMNRKPDDSKAIVEAVAAGKFVVVAESLEYCPSTDAAMGTRKNLVSVHNTRESAEEASRKEESYDEVFIYVLPIKFTPEAEAKGNIDVIPF